MTFRMIMQLWNTNTQAIVSSDADLTENYMYISMKFGTGVLFFAGKLVYLIVLAFVQIDMSVLCGSIWDIMAAANHVPY